MNRAFKMRTFFAIHALWLATFPVLAQTEGDMKKAFEGKTVAPKMDMPGSSEGVKINLRNPQPRDLSAELKNLRKYTTAIPSGKTAVITQVLAKGDTIEFRLGEGGVGRFWCSDASLPDAPVSSTREMELDGKFDKTAAEQAELARLQKDRQAEEQKAEAAQATARKDCQAKEQAKRMQGGSRFVVRYRSKLTPGDLTAEVVRGLMADYIDFSPASNGSLLSASPPTKEEEEAAKKNVVMIKGSIDGDDTVGAGLIVGAGQDRVYIVTANHVVRKGPNASRDLQVMFRWLNGAWFKADLLTTVDSLSDLAVISVSDLGKVQFNTSAFSFSRVGPTLQRTNRVRFVGFGNTQPWHEAVDAAPVSFVSSDAIKFQSAFLVPGDSGGVLFNDQWQVVGINESDQQGEATAVPFNHVQERLQEWGHPVNLKK